MIAATFAFAVNGTFLRLATEALPPFEALLLRGLFASLWTVPLLFWTGNVRRASGALHPRVIVRNGFELIAVSCFILALPRLPFADLTALTQVGPVLVVAGAAAFLNERISGIRWMLILCAFFGALLVAQPGGPNFSIFTILALCIAVANAARDLASRHVPQEIPGMAVALGALVTVMIGAALAHLSLEEWSPPTGTQWYYLAGSGAALMLGHLFIFLAYRSAPAGNVAPFLYTLTLWSLIAGWLVFGTWPNTLAQAGMVLILLGGIAIVIIESRRTPSTAR